MAIIDNKTPRLMLLLPAADNYLQDDVARLIESLNILDATVATIDDNGTIPDEQLSALIARLDEEGKLIKTQLPDDVVQLDDSGKIPGGQIPAIALMETTQVSSEKEMLNGKFKPGDVVIRLDISSRAFFLIQKPASNKNNWKELAKSVVTSVNGKTGDITGIAASGANKDITSLEGLVGPLRLNADAQSAYDAVTLRQLQAASGGGGGANMNGVMNNFVGAVEWFNGSRALLPAGYIPADGQLLNRADEPELWAAVESGMFVSVSDELWVHAEGPADPNPLLNRGKYSTGDGSTTFRVPDLNGLQLNSIPAVFLRGSGNGDHGNPGDVFEDGAPNITGSYSLGGDTGAVATGDATTSGAFISGTTDKSASIQYRTSHPSRDLLLDASKSNPVYGRSDEVRPNAATGIWIIRANGNFQSETVFNVLNGDEELPADGTVVRGGAVQSVYTAAGETVGSAGFQVKVTVGGQPVPELMATDSAGTVKNWSLPVQAGELVARDSLGRITNNTDIVTTGAAVIGEHDGIALAMRPQTDGAAFYLSGRAADNSGMWAFGNLTTGSKDVTWRASGAPGITLRWGGGIDFNATGSFSFDRQLVNSLNAGGSWASQYGTLAPYYIDIGTACRVDSYYPMIKQRWTMSDTIKGACSFGFLTPKSSTYVEAAIHLIASDPDRSNIQFRFLPDGNIASPKGTVAIATSDRRLKTDISDVDETAAVNRVDALSPKEFKWKGDYLPDNEDTARYRQRQRRGFIAQELDEVNEAYALPPGSDRDFWGWEPSAVVADLVMYVRALKREIAELRDEVAELKG